MTLVWLIAVPFVAGVAAWALDRGRGNAPRWVALAGITIDLVLAVSLWVGAAPPSTAGAEWLGELQVPWIEQVGISFHVGIDGLSLLLIVLTGLLGIMAVASSWTEIRERVGLFHFHLMWVLSGIVGVFVALDLFLFYFFWEMMLVPMYFLIGMWGHERRIYAALKFFIFTQISGLLMLIAIVALYVAHGQSTSIYTFDYPMLLGTPLTPAAEWWLMLGFFIAFAVKLPVVPVHTWLPDAHTEAPTAGSVILAGLLLKTGAYGLLKVVLPLFPGASAAFAPIAMWLGVAGVLYGAVLAFGQSDLKRLVAYTSVSHMGFVVIGVFAGTPLALAGAVLQVLSHGLSTGALFILVGSLQERTHTRDLARLGGLWAVVPRMGGMTLFFALASLGLPGLGDFIAEFLVLVGTYQVNPTATVVAALGLILSAVYALRLVQAAFQGAQREPFRIHDLDTRELAMTGVLIVGLVWLGLYPQPFVDTAAPALLRLAGTLQGLGR